VREIGNQGLRGSQGMAGKGAQQKEKKKESTQSERCGREHIPSAHRTAIESKKGESVITGKQG